MKQEIFQRRRKEFMEKMNGGVAVFGASRSVCGTVTLILSTARIPTSSTSPGLKNPRRSAFSLQVTRSMSTRCLSARATRNGKSGTAIAPAWKARCRTFMPRSPTPRTVWKNHWANFSTTPPRSTIHSTAIPEWDHRILQVIDKVKGLHRRASIHPGRSLIHPPFFRICGFTKKADELEVLQHAVEISAQAHLAAMKATKPMKYEYEVQAVVEYAFRSKGSMRNGYPSIVGSGPNSCILHYINNTRKCRRAICF